MLFSSRTNTSPRNKSILSNKGIAAISQPASQPPIQHLLFIFHDVFLLFCSVLLSFVKHISRMRRQFP